MAASCGECGTSITRGDLCTACKVKVAKKIAKTLNIEPIKVVETWQQREREQKDKGDDNS